MKVLVERVFRGHKFEKPVEVYSTSYKADYRLLSKNEEKDYCQEVKKEFKILPQYIDFPPLLKEYLVDEGHKDPKMKLIQKNERNKFSRIAKDGETPNTEVPIGLGTPDKSAMSLYEGIELK